MHVGAPRTASLSMEAVYGKVVHTMISGFLVGGGLSAFRAVDAAVRPPLVPPTLPAGGGARAGAAPVAPSSARPPGWWRAAAVEAAKEGCRTSAIVGAGTFAFCVVSLAEHGRFSEKLFTLRGDGPAVAAGVFVGALVHLGGPLRKTGALAAASAAAAGVLATLL